MTWSIEAQPIEYQAKYWRLRAEQAERQLKVERKRKEPETLAELEQELKRARESIRHFQSSEQVWKQVAQQGWDRVVELEGEGVAAVLKRERDHWKKLWRNATARLGDAIEHLGLDYNGRGAPMVDP